MPSFIVFDRVSLACALLPKCGSTTLIALGLELAGVETDGRSARPVARTRRARRRMAEAGVRIVRVESGPGMADHPELAGRTLLAPVRDPVERFLSGYWNKTSRLVAQADPRTYRRAKLAQLRRRPKDWLEVQVLNEELRRRVTIADFVAMLERLAPRVDAHFRPQTGLMAFERLAFDRVIPLDRLQDELKTLFSDRGVSPEGLDTLTSGHRHNASRRAPPDGWSDDLARRVARVYAEDYAAFAGLGFAAPGPDAGKTAG